MNTISILLFSGFRTLSPYFASKILSVLLPPAKLQGALNTEGLHSWIKCAQLANCIWLMWNKDMLKTTRKVKELKGKVEVEYIIFCIITKRWGFFRLLMLMKKVKTFYTKCESFHKIWLRRTFWYLITIMKIRISGLLLTTDSNDPGLQHCFLSCHSWEVCLLEKNKSDTKLLYIPWLILTLQGSDIWTKIAWIRKSGRQDS